MIIRNLANIITASRILLTIVMIFLPTLSSEFMIVYSLAGISDVLDGFIARKTKTVSKLGSKLDSVADLTFYTVMMHKIMPFLKKYLSDLIWCGIFLTLIIRIALYTYVGIKDKKFWMTGQNEIRSYIKIYGQKNLDKNKLKDNLHKICEEVQLNCDFTLEITE